ncbi:hypothetical protein GKZ68_05540 [Hymenobacter sp. BRD128]|uniref:hypothetical protein n=1 Tax=Hymenobacter sp. BRD128 TaxID=2675878 RepID=UPI001563C717|nr:hypothetical protein [Hymenobacter sp. BRD128]QKG56153.1 hypothetical protein GKZ68_05540 [Hymenobacter sp. BRD128]
MPARRITLCYRKIIDASATRPWDKLVLDDSYRELRLQAQYFNQEKKYRTFGELVHYVPGADRLHGLVSGAIVGYLQQLGGVVPDVLDNLGRRFLRFGKFQFELINSDLLDPSKHQVAINFFTEALLWHDTVGPYLLASLEAAGDAPAPVHTFRLQPYLAIHAIQELATDASPDDAR